MSNRVRKCNKIIASLMPWGDVAREKSSTNEMETLYTYRTLQRILYRHNNMLYDFMH